MKNWRYLFPKAIQGLPYRLRRIKYLVMPLNEALEVGLLIGLNCPRAIKPLEVIPGKEDDPYAKKTALGWGVIGAVRPLTNEDAESRSDIACNRILTYEVQGMSRRKMCHFAFQTQVKEMITQATFPGCLLWTLTKDR